jgi:hypothetical protein
MITGRPGAANRALLVVGVLLATLGVVVGAFFGGLDRGDELWPFGWVMWGPVGALILWKRPGNGVGTTMLAIGLFWGVGFFGLALAESMAPLSVRVWAEMVSLLMGVLPWLGIIWLLLVFPTGRLRGRLERVTGFGLLALAIFGVVSFAASPEPMESTGVPSPLSVSWMGSLTSWFISERGFLVVVVVIAASIVSLGLRWRASEGIERHQYRWLVMGALLFASILGIGQVADVAGLAGFAWVVAGAAIPVSVGVAVSRYRLFEIDRILSRTLSYALMVGLLASLVAGVAAVAGSQFKTPWVVAGTTLGVAAIFNPVRRKMQVWVDRRFNRSRYDAQRVMDEFAGSLRDRVDGDEVINGWLGVVDTTMQPAAVGVWLRT